MPGARMMVRGDKGRSSSARACIGKVYAITDKDGKRTRKVIAEGLKQPNGVAFKNGTLYVITIDKALRFDGIEDKLDSPQVTDVSEQIKLPAVDASQLEIRCRRPRQQALHRRSARPATSAR